MSKIVQQIAAKAVIVNSEGKVLVLREAATYGDGTGRGRYHMPGGRLAKGERFEDALRREIREETGLDVTISYPLYVGEWRPAIKGVAHQIVGIFMVCTPIHENVQLSTEHDQYEWIEPSTHQDYDIMEPEGQVIDSFIERQQ